jgi:hypothetical protein
MEMYVVTAAEGPTKKRAKAARRKPPGRTGRERTKPEKGGGDGDCLDGIARDLACSALVMWGNLVAVLIDTLDAADIPRRAIHDLLDRLDDANEASLPEDSQYIAFGFVDAIRAKLPGND